MDTNTLLAALIAAVNRLTEMFKTAIEKQFPAWSDEAKTLATQAFALVAGIAAALFASFNLFASYPSVPPLVGIVVSGAIVSMGSAVAHAVLDVVYAARDHLLPSA